MIPHEVIPCDPALADTAAFCEAYGYAPEDSANCIVVVGKARAASGAGSAADPPVHVACLVLATHRLDVNGVVRKRLGVRKASFADADTTVALTGMAIGGVTPVGLPPGLPIWIDGAVMARPKVIIGGGSRDKKLLVEPTHLLLLDGAEVVEDLARPAT